MSFLNSILKTFVGDKSKKDVKELQPLLNKIKSHEQTIEGLSLDELRNKTVEFKSRIQESFASETEKIEALQEEVKASTDIDKNEDIYSEIDKLIAIRDSLQKLDVDLLVVFAPSKAAFYPEFIPDSWSDNTMDTTNFETYRSKLSFSVKRYSTCLRYRYGYRCNSFTYIINIFMIHSC